MLAPPTICSQIRDLEETLHRKLFRRKGRRLALTETGEMVYGYADEIFSLGRELMTVMKERPVNRPLRLVVGVDEAVPKLVAREILKTVFKLEQPVHLVCREGTSEHMLMELANYRLDVIIADQPARSMVKVKAFSHPLGECGITILAAPELAMRLKSDFPRSLHRAPALLPADHTAMRRTLDRWFHALGIEPIAVGEFEDSALTKVFGSDGLGFFAVPSVIAAEISHRYSVDEVGVVKDQVERFYAISVERKLKHPAVVAITEAARHSLFGT